MNKLYNWINNTDVSKERLAAYFHWYYPKRATLIVDMLSEVQREQALTIAQSGRMEQLAALAVSDISDDEFKLIVANINKLPGMLNMLMQQVDDKTFEGINDEEKQTLVLLLDRVLDNLKKMNENLSF